MNDFKINGLKTEYMGQTVVHVEETDSTNNMAKKSGAENGTVFIADRQTAGKGRLGRSWSSDDDTGLWMSVYLTPDIPPESIANITLVCGLAVCRALNNLCNINTLIKWPNDIVVGGKKVCGILTEGVAEGGSVACAVLGIGINITTSAFSEDLADKATSIAMETGVKYTRENIAKAVLTELEKYYEKFLQGGLAAISEEYENLCVNIGKEVMIKKDGGEITGTACGLSGGGGLLIRTGGKIMEVSAGEVSVRGIYGYI